MGVSQVMEPHAGQLGPSHEAIEALRGDVGVEWRTVLLCENETRLLPLAVEGHLFLELVSSPLPEDTYSSCVDVDRASAAVGLWG